MDTIVIATRNPAKVSRYKEIFQGRVGAVIGLNDTDFKDKPAEVGKTAEENAELKARFYSKALALPVFSEDEALFVDFLPENEQPGVYVRRIDGKTEVSDEELLTHWENKIVAAPQSQRTGRWHIAYSLCFPDGEITTVVIDYPVEFFSPRSKVVIPGWPLNSITGDVGLGKPNSEYTAEEKERSGKKAKEAVLQKLDELFAV